MAASATWEHHAPEHWTGDLAAFEQRLQEVAQAIRTMAADKQGHPFDRMGTWLAHAILENEHCEARVDKTPWDCSSYGHRTGQPIDISQYETVDDFLENEYTGNTTATFCSGSGFAAESYGSAITYVLWESYSELLRKLCPDLIDPDGSVPDEVLDGLVMEDASDCLLDQAFREQPLLECFTKHMSTAILERAETERQQREQREIADCKRQELESLAGQIPSLIEEFAAKRKFEKANWHLLLEYLDRLIEVEGATEVAAAIRCAQLQLSASVSSELRARYPLR